MTGYRKMNGPAVDFKTFADLTEDHCKAEMNPITTRKLASHVLLSKRDFEKSPLASLPARLPERTQQVAVNGKEIAVTVPEGWTDTQARVVGSRYLFQGDIDNWQDLVRNVCDEIATQGARSRYFAEDVDNVPRLFSQELQKIIVHGFGTFNSPVWFNVSRMPEPQISACFLTSAKDSLLDGPRSITGLLARETKIFRNGSGSGINFSDLRAENENLREGGVSSGPMGFIQTSDANAGGIKSGGRNRRAAKMCLLNSDHPDILKFIRVKAECERRAHALASMGFSTLFTSDDSVYKDLRHQNANHSVRWMAGFMDRLDKTPDAPVQVVERVSGKVKPLVDEKGKVLTHAALWREVAEAAWICGDPGVQFDDTINKWNPTPDLGWINSSNPCVTGDTLVATENGYVRIDKLLDAPIRLVCGDGEIRTVNPAFATGTKPVYLLTLQSGLTLRVTADHKILTVDGDIRVCDLAKGQRITLGQPRFSDRTTDTPLYLFEYLGMLVGDGCETQQGQVVLTMAPDAGEAAAIAARAIAHFKAQETDGRSARSVHVSSPQGTLRLATALPAVRAFVQEWAVLDEGSEGKSFSPALFGQPRAVVASVLRGLFTTDGTVADYGNKSQYVSLDSCSLTLLQQTQLLLLGLGVRSKIYQNRRKAGTYLLPDGKGGSAVYPVRAMHSLRVSRVSRVTFEKVVGFVEGSAKQLRLRALNSRVGAYQEAEFDKVATIEYCGEEQVYDLTEPVTSHFVANGIVVHNCSEYNYIDDTSCNLASVVLTRFLEYSDRCNPTRPTGFDVKCYQHVLSMLTIAMDILISFAGYPSDEIAHATKATRPLGVGYMDLGGMLIRCGIPYGSYESLMVTGYLTSLMQATLFQQSAQMAARMGSAAGSTENKVKVLRMHRAAHDDLFTRPLLPGTGAGFEEAAVTAQSPSGFYLFHGEFLESLHAQVRNYASNTWITAERLAMTHGLRNNQLSVLAPTGTIIFQMENATTTGVEPLFSLGYTKELVGGGSFYAFADIVRIYLRSVFYYFVNAALACDDEAAYRLANDPATDKEADTFANTLASIMVHGRFPTRTEIENALTACVPSSMMPPRPRLQEELADAVMRTLRTAQGEEGNPAITPLAHIYVMAAAQPFLSGAISKTVNLPHDATVDFIEQCYRESYRLGIKAVALYRDGSKASQPLTATKSQPTPAPATTPAPTPAPAPDLPTTEAQRILAASHGTPSEFAQACYAAVPGDISADEARAAVLKYNAEWAAAAKPSAQRVKPSTVRKGETVSFSFGGFDGYLTINEYADHKPCEVFLTLARQGTSLSGMADLVAMLTSLCLQYGVPVEKVVSLLKGTTFDPRGFVEGYPLGIRAVTSIGDFLAKILEAKYLAPKESALATLRVDKAHMLEAHGVDFLKEVAEVRREVLIQQDRKTGKICYSCGSSNVIPNGSCDLCQDCGATTGCS